MADKKTEQPGRFEHYRVMTDAEGKPVKLGEGAMGVTYLAEDTNLRVKVALKVIAPSLLGDSEIVQRFQREAQAAARLRHPNVAAVYHLGTVDDTFFYTMEFVEGRTLREHVAEKGPLTIMQALDITLQMAEALGAAEKHQMVHRDIKPANIMLETTEDGLHAKLIDFGLAKPLQHDAQQTSALLTQRGTFLGTAVFASPEQVQDLPLDTRSDFYALGLTMWVMLEGRPPFEGSLHKVLYDQVHTKPPLERLLWVPAEVRELLGKLLEKLPTARPQTARELRQIIHDCKRATASTSSSQADWQRRFQVRQAARTQPWGEIYEGEDSLSGAVWLHFLRSDRFGSTDALNSVIAGVRRAIEIHHPNVLRHITVFPASDPEGIAGWIVVTEHPGAHTLLGHLQQVKQLAAAEALPLIERLAEALDCCLASDLHSAELDAARIYLKPQSAADGTGPVEVVPKLIPVDYRFSTAMGSIDDTAMGLTQIRPRGEARNSADAVQRLATLAYQCLGGSWGRITRYIPLPGLTQNQNETLREALTTKKYTRATDLLDALRHTKTPRRTAATPPTVAEATVTLSPWERLAALAAPPSTTDPTVLDRKPESTSTSAQSQARAQKSSVKSPEPEPDIEAVEPPPSTEPAISDEPEAEPESEPSAEAPVAPDEEADEAPIPPEEGPEFSASEEIAADEAGIDADASSETDTKSSPTLPPAVSPTSTSGVRTRATELSLQGSHGTKSGPISVLRQAVEREWRDAKPIFDKVTTPVRDTVTKLPRWVFIAFGVFAAVVAVGLWMIANRPVPSMSKTETDPGKGASVAVTTPDDPKTKSTTTVTPPPPIQPSLDQLLESGTEAAARGNTAALLPVWNDIQKRFPEKWSSLAKSNAFTSAVTKAWQENRLGDPAKAAHDYLPIIAAAAKNNDATILRKLSMDLEADAPAAQPYELALLNSLSEDPGKLEMMIDDSLRLVQTRKTGAAANRARSLIRQTLDPIVAVREINPRPEDQTAQLRSAYQALAPKLEALASIEEPSAMFLYADKLKQDGKVDDAIKVFERSAGLDHTPSMVKLGLLIANESTPDARKRAVRMFKMADDKGNTKASFLLGECYLDGAGVDKRNYDEALKLLNKAAADDIVEANETLGGTYMGFDRENFPGVTDKFDPTKLNPTLKGSGRLKEARNHLDKAWKRGSRVAGLNLAQLLLTGESSAADIKDGVNILEKIASLPSPDPKVLFNLAVLLTEQEIPQMPSSKDRRSAGIKVDQQRALSLMRQAASLGLLPAREWCQDRGIKYQD